MSLRMTEEEYRAFLERRMSGQKGARLPGERHATRENAGSMEEWPASTVKGGRRTKYGNERAEALGHTFDSRHEAQVYMELMARVQAGELKCVLRQVGFDLPGGIRYFADFVAVGPDDRITVYDAKSEITRKNRVYINKKKQMLACCGIEIVEV